MLTRWPQEGEDNGRRFMLHPEGYITVLRHETFFADGSKVLEVFNQNLLDCPTYTRDFISALA